MSNIVVGEKNEFEFVKSSFALTDSYFKVLDMGIDTGHQLKVNIYGAISIPYQSGINLSEQDRNKLISATVRKYKCGMSF